MCTMTTRFNIANYMENFIAKSIQSQIWRVQLSGLNREDFMNEKRMLSKVTLAVVIPEPRLIETSQG